MEGTILAGDLRNRGVLPWKSIVSAFPSKLKFDINQNLKSQTLELFQVKG